MASAPLVGLDEALVGGLGVVEVAVARQVGHGVAAFGGHELHEHAAGAPRRARLAAARELRHGDPHRGRDLLGLLEVGVRHLFEAVALERDDALVAVHVDALVDGHREMALAEQLAGLGLAALDRARHRVGVEAGIAAQAVRRVEVDDDQVHRPIGLGLEDEAALELQRRADQRSQHHRLAEEAGDRRRIVVAVEDGIERRPEPDGAAAAIERLEGEGHDDVVAALGAVEAKVLQCAVRSSSEQIHDLVAATDSASAARCTMT